MPGRRALLIGLSVLACFAVSAPVRGQANDEVNSGLQFNFSLPGARSLGMGGTFLGSSDDATAAFTNPAGLTTLRAPEVSIELRGFRHENEYIVAGHFPGQASGLGNDTHTGPVRETFDDDTTNVAFASFVYPAERWAFAIYRHQLADFESHVRSERLFVTSEYCDHGDGNFTCRAAPFLGALALDIVGYGFSGAVELGEEFSVGLGIVYYDASLESRTDRYGSAFNTGTGVGDTFGPPDFSPDNIIATTYQNVDDAALDVNLGFVWKATDRLSIGSVYRRGPTFDYRASVRNFAWGDQFDFNGRFHVPDVYGLGAVFRTKEVPFRIALDINRVRYSQLNDDFINIVAAIAATEADLPYVDFGGGFNTNYYRIDDVTEYRLGMEYTFTEPAVPVSLRLGTWLDPDHKIRYEGDVTPTEIRRFPGGSDEMHWTAGMGIAAKRFQLDLAVDVSDSVSTASLSTVFFF